MKILIIISIILLGLIFWSFWSVIFFRLWDRPTKKIRKWFLVWRSECPHCHHTLSTKNLVPIFSFLFQWWKCAYCKSPISRFYPFLELSTVIIFLTIYLLTFNWLHSFTIFWVEHWIFCGISMILSAWLLWLILLYDIKTYELHITATLFLAVLTLITIIVDNQNLLKILIWIILFWWIFLLIYYWSKLYVKIKYKKDSEWFWLWDVIIAPIIWARLSLLISPNSWFERAYLISFFIVLSCLIWLIYFWIECLIYKFLIKQKKKSLTKWMKSIPFLPSMILWFCIEILLWSSLIKLIIF